MASSVLITGGAGFIGSHLAEKLCRLGYAVTIVDKLSTGRLENLMGFRVDFVLDSINSQVDLIRAFSSKPEIVFHLAGQTSIADAELNWEADARTNILGTIAVARAAIESGTKKLIFASAGMPVYGDALKESLPIGEEYSARPISAHGISKYVAERYLKFASQKSRLEVVIFRLPNVFGPRENVSGAESVVVKFIRALLGDEQPVICGTGYETKDYVYVDDVVNAFLLAMHRGEGIYNLGTGFGTTTLQVLTQVAEQIGKWLDPKFVAMPEGEPKHGALCHLRALEELGWGPLVSLKQGIEKVVEYEKARLGFGALVEMVGND